MKNLIRFICLRRFTEQKLRTTLTIVGITLGSSVFIAFNLVSDAVWSSFTSTIDVVSGKAVLEVTGGKAGFPEEILEKVKTVTGVEHALPALEATVYLDTPRRDALLIFGVDSLADSEIRSYSMEGEEEDADPLVFLAKANSVLVTADFAARHSLRIDSPLALITPSGRKKFVIRGLLKSEGAAKAFGGNFAVMDIYSAQHVLDRGKKFDRIDITVPAGVDIASVRSDIQKVLGGGYTVDRPKSRTSKIDKLLFGLRTLLATVGFIALFVGTFLIFNTVSMTIAQRRTEIGILRALGATRLQIGALFTGEAMAGGLLGGVLGTWLGLWMARASTDIVTNSISTVILQVRFEKIVLTVPDVIFGILIGVSASSIAALFPSVGASRISPVEAIRSKGLEASRSHVRLLITFAGLAAIAVAFALFYAQTSSNLPYYGIGSLMTFLVGSALLSPWFIIVASRGFRPLYRTFFGAMGRIAGDNAVQAPGRTAVTASALMVAVSLTIAIAGLINSFKTAVNDWVENTLNADLTISSVSPIAGPSSITLPGTLVENLKTIDGIKDIVPFKISQVDYDDTSIFLIAADYPVYSRYAHLISLEGDPQKFFDDAVRGRDSVIISENLSLRRKLHVGDMIPLPTPSGMRTFAIKGVFVDYSSDQGSVGIDMALYRKYWNDYSVHGYDLYLRDASASREIREKVLSLLGTRYHLIVQTSTEFRGEVMKFIDYAFSVINAMEVVAMVIALLGITNTLLVSVLDRTREIGVLRAVGATRPQIQKLIGIEAATIGAVGALLGIFVGGTTSYLDISVINRQVSGFNFPVHVPIETCLAMLILSIIVSMCAGFYPAYRASRLNMIESLVYE